jgi:hypothetical protein
LIELREDLALATASAINPEERSEFSRYSPGFLGVNWEGGVGRGAPIALEVWALGASELVLCCMLAEQRVDCNCAYLEENVFVGEVGIHVEV